MVNCENLCVARHARAFDAAAKSVNSNVRAAVAVPGATFHVLTNQQENI
jgi:hypothetical protein